MKEFSNKESYLDSAVKDEVRLAYIDAVVATWGKHRKPAFLRALSLPGGEAVDAIMLNERLPDLIINGVEFIETERYRMQANAPGFMDTYQGSLAEFIETYVWRPSGISKDPTADGHFIGANFDYYGPACRGNILPIMKFVSDHRFVKPGHETVMSITFNKASFQRAALDRAMAEALYHEPGQAPHFYNLDATTRYMMAGLAAANPTLTIELLYTREYRNSADSVFMYNILLKIAKPDWSPEYPDPETRMKRRKDGAFALGSLVLPAGPASIGLLTNQAFSPVAVSEELAAEFRTLQQRGYINRKRAKLLRLAHAGLPMPGGSGNPEKQQLELLRKSPRLAPVLDFLSKLRPDWDTRTRYTTAA